MFDNRWLSRDEDDGEICREMAAHLPDKLALPGWWCEYDQDALITLASLHAFLPVWQQ